MAEENEHQTGVGLGHWGDQFPDTHWSLLVPGASSLTDSIAREGRFAELCRQYWYPLYAFVRRRGYSCHDAQDLTQGFFAHLLGGDRFGNLDPARGKFRSYLLGAMEHFLSDRRKYENAQKRGGGETPISIEEEQAEQRFQNEPADELSASPEKLYDRKWAITVIEETRRELEREYASPRKRQVYEAIGGFLFAFPEAGDYAAIARQLDVKEDNARKLVSRMRAQFRQLLRMRVRATVSSDEEIEDEIRYLMESFA